MWMVVIVVWAHLAQAADYTREVRALDAAYKAALASRDAGNITGARDALNQFPDLAVPLTRVHSTQQITVKGTTRVDRIARYYLALATRSQGSLTLYFGATWHTHTPDWTDCERLANAYQLLTTSLAQLAIGGFGHAAPYEQSLGLSHLVARRLRAKHCVVPEPLNLYP